MKKLCLRLCLGLFLLGGLGIFRLNNLNEIPVRLENYSTFNLVEIYVLGAVMSALAYPIYPEVAIEHMSLYSKTKEDRESDFFLQSEVVSNAIDDYSSPKKLVWSADNYMFGNSEARYALALNGATLFKHDDTVSIKVPVEYPRNTVAKLLPGIEVQEGLFWVLQKKGWYFPGQITWTHKLQN